MPTLGIRYPKTYLSTWNSQGHDSVVLGADTYYACQRRFWMPVAPFRYSEVRKVKFWWSGVNLHGVTDMPCQLRIAVGTVGANPSGTPNIVTIPDESGIMTPSPGSPLNSGVVAANKIFGRVGDAVTLLGTASRGSAALGAAVQLTIEFDRFEDTDFFETWFSPDAKNEFIEFTYLLELTGGAPTPDQISCSAFGITVVQAPSANNNTCTYLCAEDGRVVNGSGRQNYDSTLAVPGAGAADTRRTGLFRFRYHAEDWDGITGVHFHILTGSKSNNGDLLFRLVRIDNDATRATTTLFTETFDVSANEHGFYRSRNFLSLLVDGEDYGFDYRHSAASGGGVQCGDQLPCWEIIQENCSKTTVYFEARVQTTPFLQGIVPFGGGTLPDPYDAAGHFDPLHFANFPDESLLKEEVIGGLNHQTVALFCEQQLYIDPDITGDPNAFANGIGPLTVPVSPVVDSAPQLVSEWKYQEHDLTANNPINLAGARKMHHFSQSGVWQNVGGNERPGLMALKYTHLVPASEVPELGDVFDLDAFNPEGCAATSAGLGDPGVLVITNGSAIPQKFDPVANKIEDAGIWPPFCEECPTSTVGNAAVSPDGGLTADAIYLYRYTFRNCCTGKESDPSPCVLSVNTAGAAPSASVTLSFANVIIPGDDQICEICIYRDQADANSQVVMFKVGCFSVDLSPAIFVDTMSDALLIEQDPLSLLNAPMPCVTSVAAFRNRLFGLGDIPMLTPAGTVTVVNGEMIVTGSDDVEWDRCLIGKYIQVGSDCRCYEIDCLLPPEAGISPPVGRLRLIEEYEGDNATGQSYTICGHPSRLFFSEPLEAEYWPAINFLDVEPGDGDRLVGTESNFSRLVICKRNKTYVLTFRDNPLEVNVPARVSSDIGCIGARTFAQIEAGTVWLADRGLAMYDGRGIYHVPESVEINSIFTDPDDPRYVRRNSNGLVIEAVAVHYPKREQYLLLLPTVQTNRGCNLMLVWDTKLRNITLLEFCQEFLSMTVAKDDEGNERVYLGDANGFVWIYDFGDTDGVGTPGATGTVRGTVTEAGIQEDNGASFLEDATASFIQGGLPAFGGLSGLPGLSPAFDGGDVGLAGVCVYIRAEGEEEFSTVRSIFAISGTRIYVTPSWGSGTPDVGSEYMIGPIKFEALFKPRGYGTDDMLKRNWRQVLTHNPEESASRLEVELLPDLQLSDDEEDTVQNDSGETGRLFYMDYYKGRQTRPVGRRIHNYMGVRLKNFAPEEPIAIINHTLDVEGRQSK